MYPEYLVAPMRQELAAVPDREDRVGIARVDAQQHVRTR